MSGNSAEISMEYPDNTSKICPECAKNGLKSTIFEDCCATTMLYAPPFYDEQGHYHHHNPNAHHQKYVCSNGHIWIETTRDICWCGWPENKEVKNETSSN